MKDFFAAAQFKKEKTKLTAESKFELRILILNGCFFKIFQI